MHTHHSGSTSYASSYTWTTSSTASYRGSAASIVASTRLGSLANLINTNVGVGLLTLPSTLKYTGVVAGIGLLLLACGVSTTGLYLLVECMEHADNGRLMTLPELVEQGGYRSLRALVDLGTICTSGGFLVAYLLVIEDYGELLGEHCFGPHAILASRPFWIGTSLCCVGWACFLRRMNSLRFVSFGACACICFLLVFFVLYFFPNSTFCICDPACSSLHAQDGLDDPASCGEPSFIVDFGPGMIVAFSTLIGALTPHYNMVPITSKLRISGWPLVALS